MDPAAWEAAVQAQNWRAITSSSFTGQSRPCGLGGEAGEPCGVRCREDAEQASEVLSQGHSGRTCQFLPASEQEPSSSPFPSEDAELREGQ